MTGPTMVQFIRRRALPHQGGAVMEFACVCGGIVEARQGMCRLIHLGRQTRRRCGISRLGQVSILIGGP